MDSTDIVIIGGGVVGLATAAQCAVRFPRRSVVLLERNSKCGQETSSRNSEVIHAGIYYPPGSLKAALCVEGNALLYEFCKRWGVPHSRTGKIIAAADDDEAAALKELKGWAEVNGVHDLTWLDSGQLAHIEPEVRARCALFSPSTGVVDTHQLMSRLEALCTQNGASVVCRHEVTGIRPGSGTHTVDYRSPCGTGERLRCRWLINCAGLCADRIAACAGIDVRESGYRLFFCKGEYFSIPAGQARRIRHLIYPPPYRDLRGLGIHVTKCIDGTVKLGPNAFYVDDIDFTVNPGHAELFFESVCPYLPFLAREDLQPDMAGIRPKLQAPGEMIKDFVIRHEAGRGMEGIINLVGIESPGLTSCLSIARMVADIICGEKS